MAQGYAFRLPRGGIEAEGGGGDDEKRGGGGNQPCVREKGREIMAKIGLKYPKYSKVTISEDASGNETEAYGTVKKIGRAVSASFSINFSDEKYYADDGVAESDPEFIDGTVDLEVDDIEPAVIADLCGATLGTGSGEGAGDLTFAESDAAAYCRFGFIVPMIRRGTKAWVAFVYCRVKFSSPQDNFQTKGESISFQGTQISGDVMKNHEGKWKIQSAMKDTEAAAVSWLDAHLAPAST